MDTSSGGAKSTSGAQRRPGQTLATILPMYNSQPVAFRADLPSLYTHRLQSYLNFLYCWYLVSTTFLLRNATLQRQVYLPPASHITTKSYGSYTLLVKPTCLSTKI